MLQTELLSGRRTCAPELTPPHRERTKTSLEAIIQPDLRAPPTGPANTAAATLFLPVKAHRTAVLLTESKLQNTRRKSKRNGGTFG